MTLVEGSGGELYGQYGVAETWGKYGASDELIFTEGADVAHAVSDDEVSMLGTGVLGGLGGLGGVAGVIGGVSVVDELTDCGGGTNGPTVDDGEIGIVNGLSVTTIGGVVRPGEEILQIIPMGEELFVEARVKPEDIANIRPGQKATVKLSAYDYMIYGALKGAVDVISADTFKDEKARDPEASAHYKVTVRVDMDQLSERQSRIEIRPGMQATVELHTGAKTVLQYLLKPLYKSREALREP